MKNIKIFYLKLFKVNYSFKAVSFFILIFYASLKTHAQISANNQLYNSTTESLVQYTAPEWFEDAKIGFWVHWGVYSVPAFNGNHDAAWYGRWMYCKEGQSEHDRGLATHNHHIATYGDPAVFGYKDFIPMFKAEKFNANEWVDLAINGGAKFFCMMGVHHDNFALWDTRFSKYNSVNMGPKKDLVGLMEKAARAKGLKFGVSNHSAWNFDFFKFSHINHDDAVDTATQDLYGNPIIQGMDAKPSERDISRWLTRTKELAEKYKPDLYYFDWDINYDEFLPGRRNFAAYYYNLGINSGKGSFGKPGVVMTSKFNAFPSGASVLDHERTTEPSIAKTVWQTDDCVYERNWGYDPNARLKSANTIIDELADVVSKRGVLMLSFAPKSDGTFPEDQKALMLSIGKWLKICGEAIYATRPWTIYGQGPSLTNFKSKTYTPDDLRFTTNKARNILYAIVLERPQKQVIIEKLPSGFIDKSAISEITLIGYPEKLKWQLTSHGLVISLPPVLPLYDYAYPIKIVFKNHVPDV